MEALGAITFGVFFIGSIRFAGELRKEIDLAKFEQHKKEIKKMQEQINTEFKQKDEFNPESIDIMVAEFEKRYDRQYGLSSIPKELISKSFYSSMLSLIFYFSPIFISLGIILGLAILFGGEKGALASTSGGIAMISGAVFGFFIFYFVHCPICAKITGKPGVERWLQNWLLFKRKA